MRLCTALLLACFSCRPAQSPSARDVATTAVVLIDDALAVAIAVAPEPYDASTWGDRVRWVRAAADSVESGGSLCPHARSLLAVAEGIGCPRCSVAIETARRALKC